MTGNSHPFFPVDLTKFKGSECSRLYDEPYQDACSVEVRRHLRQLHVGPKNSQRWSHFKTESSCLSAWIRRWKARCQLKNLIDLSRPAYRRKAQLYGVIGALFLRMYWYQNSGLLAPEKCYALSQLLKAGHPHDPSGRIPLWAQVSQVRDISLAQIERIRPELLVGDGLRKGFVPKVLVVHRVDCWERAPLIKVRWSKYKKMIQFNVKNLREDEVYVRGMMAEYRRYGNNHCAKALWLYKKLFGSWPVATVHYQLLTGLSFVCWPEKLPKLTAPPSAGKRRRKKEEQYPLEITGEPEIHPFEKTDVIWRVEENVPWSDLKWE